MERVTTYLGDEKTMGNYIETYTGKRIFYDNIKSEDITIIDIGHALSQLCRYTGHTKEFYSIAQHSILVSDNLGTLAEKRAGLLHDASEAYINDLASPLKKFLGDSSYTELEDDFHEVINRKFNITDGMTSNIKKVDLQALFTEKRDVTNNAHTDWGWGYDIEMFKDKIIPLPPKGVKRLFFDRFKKLFSEFKI
jgi:hypothetical protein